MLTLLADAILRNDPRFTRPDTQTGRPNPSSQHQRQRDHQSRLYHASFRDLW